METRPKRLLTIAAIIIGLTLYWGCTQHEQILSDKTQTVLELKFHRMPTNPPGMFYALGVADGLTKSSSGADSLVDATIIATFGYDFDQRVITDTLGSPRADSGRFVLDEDLFNFGYLFVSVQRTDGSDEGVGPIMLIDEVTDPFDNPINLVFPLSNDDMYAERLTESFAFYHMMTVSDEVAQGDTSEAAWNENGAALWFSTVEFRLGEFQDTFSLDTAADIIDTNGFTIDTVWISNYGDDSCRTYITDISNVLDSVVIKRGFGLDTVEQYAVRYDMVVEEHCVPVGYDSATDSLFSTEVTFEYILGDLDSFDYYDHVQVGNEFKDPSGYGWKYEGWVLSELISGDDIGGLTPPAWVTYNTYMDSVIRGADGGLLSTGQFTSLEKPDESNPYALPDQRIPLYPGEDFLTNLPAGVTTPLQLVPEDQMRSHGSILITLEPENRLDSMTNFPLIVNVGSLPQWRDLWWSQPFNLGIVEGPNAEFPSTQDYYQELWNKTNTNDPALPDVLVGFPLIEVSINRM